VPRLRTIPFLSLLVSLLLSVAAQAADQARLLKKGVERLNLGIGLCFGVG